MKSTGVIRRIDDLGRIVLPKEIRKNLRISDGEQLEIFIDGELIILKKHSFIGQISNLANLCINAVSEMLDGNLIITDRDKVIAASPVLKDLYLEKLITGNVSTIMLKRKPTVLSKEGSIDVIKGRRINGNCYFYPLLIDGDVIGLVIYKTMENEITDITKQMINLVGNIIKSSFF